MFKQYLRSLTLGGTVAIASGWFSLAAAQNAKKIPLFLSYQEGITIEWYRTNSVIKKIWLDNPTFATLDFDGCVVGYNGCKESDAQAIHLKRIKDLKLKGFPPANSTLMTVITQDADTGKREVHLYTIVKANKTNKPLVSNAPQPTVAPPAPATPTITASGIEAKELANKITTTIRHPQIQSQIERPMRNQLIRLASLLNQGTPEVNALRQTGVSPQVLKSIINFKPQL